MIDLTLAKNALLQAEEILGELDGLDLDDGDAVYSQPRSELREARAQTSKDMLLLVDKLTLSALLVKDAYWVFKGEGSVFDEEPDNA